MSVILLPLLYAVAARAFLFEIKFSSLRDKLSLKYRLFDIFLSCPFCNGFWCGAVTYVLLVQMYPHNFYELAHWVYFSIATGFISWLQRLYTSQWDKY